MENCVKKSSIDRGWAWVVLWAVFMGYAVLWGTTYNVGVLNVLFLEAFDDTRANTGWIGAVNSCLVCAIGPISSMFVNKIGFRWTIVLGGILAAVGSATSFFASSVLHLIVSFGVIGGLGLGLCFTPLISVVGLYFHKYRIMATALSCVGSGIGTIVFAPLIQTLADTYDWRGVMLIIGAIQLNMCVFGALIRPLPAEVFVSSVNLEDSESEIIDAQKTQKPSPQWEVLEVLKNKKLVIMLLNMFFIAVGLFIVFVHLSAYAIAEGATHVQSSMLMSVVGIASIIARVLIAAPTTDSNVGVHVIYIGSLGVTGLAVMLTPILITSLPGQFVVAFLFGFYSSGYIPLQTPLVVEFVGLKLLTASFGMINLMSGIGTLIGPPVAGWIYDMSGDYKYGFFLAGLMLLLSSTVMFIIPVLPNETGQDDIPKIPENEVLVVQDDFPESAKCDEMNA